MKKYFVLLVSIIIGMSHISAQTNNGLVFWLSGNKSLKDASGQNVKIQGNPLHRATDPLGNEGKAYVFDYSAKNPTHFLKTDLDISPKQYPELTITLWIKPSNTNSRAEVIVQGETKEGRGLGIAYKDNTPCWAAHMGKNDDLKEGRVTAQWHFLAVIYHQAAEKAWLVVNDEVFSGRTAIRPTSSSDNTLTIGKFEGQISDLRVYNRMLTLDELNELAGKPIKATAADFSFKIRRDFKKERKEKELRQLDSLPLRIVYVKELAVYDTTEGKNIVTYLHKGDTLRLLRRTSEYGIFEYANHQVGRNSLNTLIKKTYPSGQSSLSAFFTHGLQNGVDYTSWRFWVVILLLGLGLFFLYKYFVRIDAYLIYKGQHRKVESARKGDTEPLQAPIVTYLRRIFPIQRFRRWTFLIGFVAAATLFLCALIDGSELEWFINGGFTLFPGEDYHGFTYFLWAMTMGVMLLFFLMIVESFVSAGLVWGFIRIIFITVINVLLMIVALFAAIAVLLIVVAVIAFLFFGSALKSSLNQNYRCNKCGNIIPDGGRCPYCG
jgi:hypothetical protein